MNFKFFPENFKISSRKFAAATLLTSGTLAWFFLLAFVYLTDIFKTLTFDNPFWSYYTIGQMLFYGFAIFWAIVGSFVGARINRRKLLLPWISLGVFATVLLAAFQGTTFAAISSFLLGLSFGLGLPSSMAFIAECTVVEERARVSGVIILGTFVIAFISIFLARILSFGMLDTVLLLAIVRSISFVALALDKCEREPEKEKPRVPSTAYREFAFYLFPWVMFITAASITGNLIPQTSDYATAYSIGTILRYFCIAIFGLASGLAADRFGRKQPIVVGLIVLGVSFALLGLYFTPRSLLVYLTLSGVAWGSFFVVYLTIFGDLSVSGSREKFYGLGFILPLVVFFVMSAVPFYAIFSIFSASSFSQIFSIILFLSIIPVLRAKETLPVQKIQEREMKEHVKKIGKLVKESKETDHGET
jgi:MFS family permease